MEESPRRNYQEGLQRKIKEQKSIIEKLQNEQLAKKIEDNNTQLKSLNTSYAKTVETNRKWENLKTNEMIIGSYSGAIENFLCNLTSNHSSESCKPNT
ncbi:hypothetical protein [Candidatus Mycoplasma haematominutum]|uniref:Uncharacterized protein n=1 Tax=Candidatus Mycoplasma haematominutum 'Birmingham 1' TaxID=1116213 RepID=G8C3E2_9MOLU|nr:hypothetical protein [Candidatus Mycoplasma haematominutum]CCE66840.1 hypothetical protein MHM_03220 [Candidatus Mycoplasma haematominutum 'Birmingham 1']